MPKKQCQIHRQQKKSKLFDVKKQNQNKNLYVVRPIVKRRKMMAYYK